MNRTKGLGCQAVTKYLWYNVVTVNPGQHIECRIITKSEIGSEVRYDLVNVCRHLRKALAAWLPALLHHPRNHLDFLSAWIHFWTAAAPGSAPSTGASQFSTLSWLFHHEPGWSLVVRRASSPPWRGSQRSLLQWCWEWDQAGSPSERHQLSV